MSNTRLQPYSEELMQRHWNFIDQCAEMGDARFFEIWVDNEQVISRTDNPAEFEHYRYYVNARTKTVKVVIYRDRESEAKEEFFMFIKEPERQSTALSGIEIEQRINDTVNAKVKEAKQEWDHKSLREKFEALEEELDEANEYIDHLQKENSRLKDSKHKIGDIHMGELASVMVESFLKRTAANLPGGEMLAGFLGQGDQAVGSTAPQQQAAPETTASFSKAAPAGPALSPVDLSCLNTGRSIHKAFSAEELREVFAILMKLGKDKALIAVVTDLIKDGSSKAA